MVDPMLHKKINSTTRCLIGLSEDGACEIERRVDETFESLQENWEGGPPSSGWLLWVLSKKKSVDIFQA